MESLVAAAIGFVAAVFGVLWTTRAQRQNDYDVRILDARVQAYNACSDALYEYARASHNRTKARFNTRISDVDREPYRQEHYRANTRARSSIGQVAIVTGDQELTTRLERARRSVSAFQHAEGPDELKSLWSNARDDIGAALEEARKDLAPRSGPSFFHRRDAR